MALSARNMIKGTVRGSKPKTAEFPIFNINK